MWNLLKKYYAEDGSISPGEIAKFDSLVRKRIRVAAGQPIRAPEEFRATWEWLKPTVIGMTKKEFVNAVLTHWKAGYSVVFTSPDFEKAYYFLPREPGAGSILEFEFKGNAISQAATCPGIYVGFENSQFEVGFGTPQARKLLFESFERAVQIDFKLKAERHGEDCGRLLGG